MSEYIIVQGQTNCERWGESDQYDIEKLVSEKMAEGYRPVGGLVLVMLEKESGCQDRPVFAQAMVKES